MDSQKSNFKHYFRGFIITSALLCACSFIGNLVALITEEASEISRSSISDVHNNYIIASIFIFGVLPLNLSINMLYNFCLMQGKCCKTCNDCWLIFSICNVTVTGNFLSFNAVYVFMGLIAAPIATGSLIFLYATVFFLFSMFFTLISRGGSIAWKQLRKQQRVDRNTDPEAGVQQIDHINYMETDFCGVTLCLVCFLPFSLYVISYFT